MSAHLQLNTVEVFLDALKNKGMGNYCENAKILLEGIRVDLRRAQYARQKSLVLQSVVPTLNTVDCVCDLRAVFSRLPSPSQSDEHHSGIKVLLGFEPVVQVTVNTNDAINNDHACVFQMTEYELKRTIKVLQEAAMQLQVMKESKVSLGRIE